MLSLNPSLATPTPVPAPYRRRQAHRFGHAAEASVRRFLWCAGYGVLGTRCRTDQGEIDIVALHRDCVAFIEVKARRNIWDGIDAVGARKQKRLIQAANAWRGSHPAYRDYSFRFDVALVGSGGELEYIENAFEYRAYSIH